MDLKELPKVSYTIAVEHGWWEEDRPLVDLIMLIVTEVAEAIEDYRKNHAPNEMWFEVKGSEGQIFVYSKGMIGDKPCGIPSELADIVIRIADIIGSLDDPNSKLAVCNIPKTEDIFELDLDSIQPSTGTFIEGLFKLTYGIVMSLYEQPDGEIVPRQEWFRDHMKNALRQTFALARQFDIDLMEAIDLKTTYNRIRPYKHGGKKL
jgi:NTP pyrophosphatase (non-canonical NTP hydrolase)